MTSRIHRLDALTASRIAAGEVIERPASVVKELLDNALDAGSTRIDIDLLNGGRRLIQVTDNGCGMSGAEAVLALQRFTTSKIRHIDDLSRLSSLGFRGEALPSIATVAQIEMITRAAGQPEGSLVHSRAGAEPQAQTTGCPPGTRVRVLHLFSDMPVRQRALTSVAREVQIIQELVAHYALAHPQVTLHVKHDGRRLLFAPASTDLRQRLAVLFSQAVAEQLLPISWHSADLLVQGAVGPPGLHRATRQRQYCWVNGRPVRSPLVSAAVERAYGARLPAGRRPVMALGIVLSPAFLDVNVHPRKAEIKFVHERAIFAAVQEAVEMGLQGLETAPVAWDDAPGTSPWDGLSVPALRTGEAPAPYDAEPGRAGGTVLHPLGQLGNMFIVASGAQGLLVLDQHAAHESLLYEQLLTSEPDGVEPPETLVVSLSASHAAAVQRLQPILATFGLQLEPFGRDMLLARAIPRALQALLRPGNLIEALQEALQRATLQSSPEAWREHLAAALACRTAVRAGDVLGPERLAALVDAVAQQRLAYTCPHGRPTYVTLSLAELERRFLRRPSSASGLE